MKKVISLALMLILLLSISPVISAEETGTQLEPLTTSIAVTADSVNTLPDREITVPVSISGNPGFTNLAVALEYDPAKLELKSISVNNGILGEIKNRINILWKRADQTTCGFLVAASPTAVTGNGTLFTATFMVHKDFTDTTAVTPNILYLRSNAGDHNVFQTIPTNVTEGAIHAILAGDVNGDGVVEYDDVMAAYQEVRLTDKTFSEDQMKVADLNGNGFIDEGDVSAIYNIYTGGNET